MTSKRTIWEVGLVTKAGRGKRGGGEGQGHPLHALVVGEMVVPQAKTLGTHKIYFDPSPPLEADGDKQLNIHAIITSTSSIPLLRDSSNPVLPDIEFFPCSNPTQLTRVPYAQFRSSSRFPRISNIIHHVGRSGAPQEARHGCPNWYVHSGEFLQCVDELWGSCVY